MDQNASIADFVVSGFFGQLGAVLALTFIVGSQVTADLNSNAAMICIGLIITAVLLAGAAHAYEWSLAVAVDHRFSSMLSTMNQKMYEKCVEQEQMFDIEQPEETSEKDALKKETFPSNDAAEPQQLPVGSERHEQSRTAKTALTEVAEDTSQPLLDVQVESEVETSFPGMSDEES
eukprot:CAMPEP_0185844006 /NCGR_PEP_ID=MMETSP1354-20130828/338_1 /TAXON_ID=708628 /ORGANISM="Erythrolobus madagascarensis, Strain CCMP3276" /LENGTH=175 /DNA_ID=CAMNT_0028543611 /DNA_START=156 /DNA_END=683 /DNA_ORIENTATION=+